MGSEDALLITNLSAGYEPDLPIIRSIDLFVGRQSIVAVVGANGAGKSTLIKTIYGFLKPQSGTVVYEGHDVTGWDPYDAKKGGVAYIPQELTQFPDMTVEENLKMGMWVERRSNSMRDQLGWLYGLFTNLEFKRLHRASTLSGGEAKMLDIARGLMVKPKLLLVDEPSIGLSPAMAEQVYDILKRVRHEGITILLVDQNVKRAIELSDYTYVMETGEIRHHGPSNEIKVKIDKIVEATLMGDLIKL